MHKKITIVLFAIGLTVAVKAQTPAEDKFKKGDFAGAVTEYTKEIDKIDAEVQTLIKKRAEYEKMSEYERALVDGGQLMEPKADWSKLYFGRGKSYSGLTRKADAVKDFSTAIALDPKNGEAYYERALLINTSDNKENACIDISTAASLGVEKAKILFDDNFCWNIAMQHYKEGASNVMFRKYEEAIKELDVAIKLSPDSGRYYSKRGQAYAGLGKTAKAMEDFTKATEIQPNNSEGYYQIAMTYFNKDDFENAIKYFNLAIEKNPTLYDGYLNRATACERQQRFTSAIYDYGRCISLRPNDGIAYLRRGQLEKEMKNNLDACKDFARAAQLGVPEAQEYANDCLDPNQKKPKQPKKKGDDEEEKGE